MTKRTSLVISTALSLTDWQNLGRQIHTIAESSAWWLGDWLIYGQSEYPDRYKQAIDQTSLDYQTLRNYAWIARRFQPEQRHPRLSMQHHAEAAGLPDDQRSIWLGLAEQHGWSRNELRRRIKDRNRRDAPDDTVLQLRVKLIESQRQRWQEAAQRSEQDLLSWMVEILDDAAASAVGTVASAAPAPSPSLSNAG